MYTFHIKTHSLAETEALVKLLKTFHSIDSLTISGEEHEVKMVLEELKDLPLKIEVLRKNV